MIKFTSYLFLTLLLSRCNVSKENSWHFLRWNSDIFKGKLLSGICPDIKNLIVNIKEFLFFALTLQNKHKFTSFRSTLKLRYTALKMPMQILHHYNKTIWMPATWGKSPFNSILHSSANTTKAKEKTMESHPKSRVLSARVPGHKY